MKNYVGCKIIKAEKVKFSKYLECKFGTDYTYTGSMPLDKEVYMVIYPPIGEDEKPYISMSPIEVFKKCYREIEDSEISLCLEEDII